MNRILEFSPSQEEAVVSRILVLVHQAMDEHFPAVHANRQFTKTVFSDDASEKTATMRPAGDAVSGPVRGFGSDEVTSPDGRPGEPDGDTLPPPPPKRGARSGASDDANKDGSAGRPPRPPKGGTLAGAAAVEDAKATAAASRAAAGSADAAAPAAQPAPPPGSRPTRLETSMTGIGGGEGPDWVTRATLALLIAGVVLLAYVLFS